MKSLPAEVYPNGVLVDIRESENSCETAQRVEFFAETKKKAYGILVLSNENC
jgi:hypothetical protein